VVLPDAQTTGMPVIATWHCDIPNVIIDGKTGLLVPERDVNSLAEAILSLAFSPESWVEMGKTGRKRVEKEFDVGAQVSRLENIYGDFVSLHD
jgi:colanic acid/amylovoran biosynthesis glycosyltransferase